MCQDAASHQMPMNKRATALWLRVGTLRHTSMGITRGRHHDNERIRLGSILLTVRRCR
jgi:hypothetical protein